MVKFFVTISLFLWLNLSHLTLPLAYPLEASSEAATKIYPIKQAPQQKWSFSGPFGVFDKAQLQRGFQVYYESCAACHSLQYLKFRDLEALGFTKAQIIEIAKNFQMNSELDENGESIIRAATLKDYIPPPFANAKIAALANNGAIPPDLSLMSRARAPVSNGFSFLWDILTNYNEYGADYLTAFLMGYNEPVPPADKVPEGLYYNPYYLDSDLVSMPPPLRDGQIHYKDGTDETVEHYAQDVSAFLRWAADPHMEKRKQIGFCVLLFLLLFSLLLYAVKTMLFKDLERKDE